MALGRISGPLLKANLERLGVDLAFETDLLYLNVNDSRIGVNTNSPQYDLDVNGTTGTTNFKITNEAVLDKIRITGNTISTDEQILNLGSADDIIYQNRIRIDDFEIQGNVISTTESNSDIEFRPNGTGIVESFADVRVNGNIHATGNISADGDIVIGDQVTDTITFNANISSDLIPETDDTYNLGSPTRRWRDIYAAGLNANRIAIADILIEQNTISTISNNTDLQLTGSGAGGVVVDNIKFKDNTITADGDLSITSSTGNVLMNNLGSLTIPVGTTAERPTPSQIGMIRYNTDDNLFEAYDGNWFVLSGVWDLDRDSRITAELTPGANDNTIRFYTNGVLRADINSTRFRVDQLEIDNIVVNDNYIETNVPDTDIIFNANGTGDVVIENFGFNENTILNKVPDSVTVFDVTNNGYYKFTGTFGFVVPSGNSSERPPTAVTEIGMMRWNTFDNRMEVFDGIEWGSVAGSNQGGITEPEAEQLAIEYVLMLG